MKLLSGAEWAEATFPEIEYAVEPFAPIGDVANIVGAQRHGKTALVAGMVVDAVEAERFLILTDPIAQNWMEMKTTNLERWLHGMRRLQEQYIEQA